MARPTYNQAAESKARNSRKYSQLLGASRALFASSSTGRRRRPEKLVVSPYNDTYDMAVVVTTAAAVALKASGCKKLIRGMKTDNHRSLLRHAVLCHTTADMHLLDVKERLADKDARGEFRQAKEQLYTVPGAIQTPRRVVRAYVTASHSDQADAERMPLVERLARELGIDNVHLLCGGDLEQSEWMRRGVPCQVHVATKFMNQYVLQSE